MPEWLIERGIGETRYALVEKDRILETRIQLDEMVGAGSVISARLVRAARANSIALDDSGTEYLLPRGSFGVTEGAAFNIEVTREAIPGTEPWKRPLARISDEAPHPPSVFDAIELPFPGPANRLAAAGWDDLIEEARSGIVRFAGGELRISPTPAMTLIDVDGHLEPSELAVLGSAEAARAIRRLGIGGSIGIDLPTTASKSARQEAAAAIDANVPQPFERTAVNGFGFVQIVRPRRHASLVELAQDRALFEARALLRRAALERAGPRQLVAHPAALAAIEARPAWIEQLSRQVGGEVRLRPDATLPISGGYGEDI